jgi:sulfur-carrier protein adenylyltransferase/sulfurtransferase
MMTWFLDDMSRLSVERRCIEELESRADWLSVQQWTIADGNLCLDAAIEAANQRFEIRLEFPAVFPACPPAVRPRDEQALWSSHQYGRGGELCLEWGPDNWQPECNAAQILESAHRLLSVATENNDNLDSVLPSRHLLTTGQKLRGTTLRFGLTAALLEYAAALGEGSKGTANLVMVRQHDSLFVVVESVEAKGLGWHDPEIPKYLENLELKLSCTLLATGLERNILMSADLEKMRRLINERFSDDPEELHPWDSESKQPRLLLIRDVEGGFHLFWFTKPPDEKLLRFTPVALDEARRDSRLSPDFSVLKAKKVAIVGLGSVGGKIAESLCRSGVREFYLIDHDILLPGNLARHCLDWRNVSEHKVDGVTSKLKLILPNVRITVSRLKLSGQEASASVAGVLRKIGDYDVVIDATANPSTFNCLSSVVSKGNCPFVWMEVFPGGLGGMVARWRPQIDPFPQIMKAKYHRFLEEQPRHNIELAADYAAQVEGEVVVADDADVSIIAGHATHMALDLLLERQPTVFPYSLYVFGLRRGWFFQEPFEAHPIDVGSSSPGTSNTLSCQEQLETIDFLKRAIHGRNDDNCSSG